LPRNAQKCDLKNQEKIGFGFLSIFSGFFFHTIVYKKCFVVFLNSHRRETPKKAKNENQEKPTLKLLPICFGKVFDMDFLQKYLCGVFELPLPIKCPKTY
jgi:hypothetical protein